MTEARKWVAVDFGGSEVLRCIDVDVPGPGPNQVTIGVRAVGLNPADAKHIAPGQDPKLLPLPIGYEVAGVITAYGPGLLERIRAAAPEGVTAALDTVGSGEAGDVSLAMIGDRRRVVTIADATRAKADGYVFVGASNPESGPFRARARSRILELAQDRHLAVPMAATFQFENAPAAFTMLTSPHPPGKIALVNEQTRVPG